MTLLTEPERDDTSDEDKYLKTVAVTKGELIRNQIRTKGQIVFLLICYGTALGFLKAIEALNSKG